MQVESRIAGQHMNLVGVSLNDSATFGLALVMRTSFALADS